MKRIKDHQFHFKQFSVRHDRSGMKVGTDGVLLGAWVSTLQVQHALDVGTGTGVIALMLAQRTQLHVQIDAVEIDSLAFEDATENFFRSPWKNRLRAALAPVQNFNSTHPYDLLVSNPPYFQNSYKPTEAKRVTARHTQDLPFSELLNAATRLLNPAGRLAIIIPPVEGIQFIDLAKQQGFTCIRKWSFRSRSHKPVERLLMEFSKQQLPLEEGEIVLYSIGETWSDQYADLTRDFYLKL